MDAQRSTAPEVRQLKDRLWLLLTSPYAWGAAATCGFYMAIPHLPVHRELAERYFASHPVEYAQTALFFVGLCILVHKLTGLRSQREALRTCILHAATDHPPASSADPTSRLSAIIENWSAKIAAHVSGAWINDRLSHIRQYLTLKPTAEALEVQLKDLEQRADDELHDSFALLQTINWAIPIMGILGTVLGVTMAFFQLDANNLQASLGGATSNLATAFDTTVVALCHSLILIFLYRFVRGSEEQTLGQVGAFCRRHILTLLPADLAHAGPFIEAESEAARQLVARTGQLVESQTQLWAESIESMRSRWSGTLAAQQQSLAEALQSGTHATLQQHSEHLAALRREFSKALEQLAQQRQESDAKQRSHEAAIAARWESGITQLAAALSAAQQSADERSSRLLTELGTQITGWKSQLQTATGSLSAHVERLSQHEKRVCDLLERGDDVHSLEEKLTQNLQALRSAASFDQTMHSLSAAVHLLTAHARQRAA